MGASAPPAFRGGRSDTRRGGDNGTPPRKPGPDSVEARTGEASCGLKENHGSFRVRHIAAALCSLKLMIAPQTTNHYYIFFPFGGFAFADGS